MNNETSQPNATEMSFAVSARYLDEQVGKGRSLDDVLAEQSKVPGGDFWFNLEALATHGSTVAKSALPL